MRRNNMKAILREKTEEIKERKYPYLGIFRYKSEFRESYSIVLFTDSCKGVFLDSTFDDKDEVCGKYSDDLREHKFIPFEGEIILKND
jgi:hypothetical protein